MLIQLLCADKPTKAETIEAYNRIGLWIADSLEAYADSLRAIVRDADLQQVEVDHYKSVYVTVSDEESGGASYPLELRDGKWVWENVTVTARHVIINDHEYPIQHRNPLYAVVRHKGKTFSITE